MVAIGKSVSVSGLLVFGTTTSLLAKIVYELKSVGKDGEEKYFRKPWAMTTLMFLGMSFCLPLAYYQERQARKARRASGMEDPLLETASESGKRHSQLREVALLALPTAFDLVATILMNIGLLYVTASVYQMMRGAEMLFAAAFAIAFLGRKLNRFHAMGIVCCVVGITLVGTSSILSGEGSSTHTVTTDQMLLGMGLIITSQAVQAAQLTFEDFFMADLNIPGVKIVGFEGVIGAALTLGVMMPIAYFLPGPEGEGIHEDMADTWAMIRNSTALQAVLVVDAAALLLYNVAGMAVTGHLGAVFRTVLETMRTLFVWLVDLLLFYTPLGLGQLGESWSVYSWLQAAGFVVLVSGTLVYRHGDYEANRRLLVEALALRHAEAPPEAIEEATGAAAAAGHHGAAATAPGSGSGVSAPLLVPAGAASQPIVMDAGRGSFRASQTIAAGSYSRSSLHAAGSYMARSPWAGRGGLGGQAGGGGGGAHGGDHE
ncbi:hypothetical protein HYH02_007761 [Chlamydomonas schloesseri]|uniref:EamA domain-containing protein n=1 Tax=Chlamydomonas schloesseri TaxID=2026947 RepID=A0A835WHU2_9CHLO|nr:hypothetical protein HYH02_007761 [Chlamydomonas schloesseri]|eukprot:KAG2447436.1 hypothetical protein HYH02_007761 [Chlamydomonas schloesseri]